MDSALKNRLRLKLIKRKLAAEAEQNKMAPKQQLEKIAWQWARTTKPENVSEENIRSAYRVDNRSCNLCRRNCKGNPHCLGGLGEKRWLSQGKTQSDYDNLTTSFDNELRTKGEFIGLKNLGATCYVNTFLQVWYHTPEFCRAVLLWKDFSADNCGIPSEDKDTVLKIFKSLQTIFGLMAFSDKKFVDPTILILSLNLDNFVQQDAQEFSKLFISKLEQLPGRDDKGLFQDLVGGYDYVTRCSQCGRESRSTSTFHELDLNIKGHSRLSECMDEFLKQEELTGENQYFCQQCNSKQNAVRAIELGSLPSVLNFQLLRFVYDREKRARKKLTSQLYFPETLDMGQYVNQENLPDEEKDSLIYDLSSVLIHRGSSASSGHYIAIIRDCKTKKTYQFNDEEVTELGDDLTRIDLDSDKTDANNKKRAKALKGELMSANAYMLVYRRQQKDSDSLDEISLDMLPEELQCTIISHNEEYKQELQTRELTNVLIASRESEKQDLVVSLYTSLYSLKGVDDDSRLEHLDWISTDWLTVFLPLEIDKPVPKIDNSKLLCRHGKLSPDEVVNAKLIPSELFVGLMKSCSCLHRLQCLDSFCRDCVVERCRRINIKASIDDDLKHISTIQSTSTDFWVGKSSWRGWRRMAEKCLHVETEHYGEDEAEEADQDSTEQADSTDQAESADISDVCHLLKSSKVVNSSDGNNSADVNNDDLFNDDLLCCHKNLNPDESCRRAVSAPVWNILKKYFPSAPEFPFNSPVCMHCEGLNEQERAIQDENRVQANMLKKTLSNLFYNKRRPVWSNEVTNLFIISAEFLEQWRQCIKDPRFEMPHNSSNRTLLCSHNKLMYDLQAISIEEMSRSMSYLSPVEWQQFKELVEVDVEISVQRVPDQESGLVFFITTPELCQQCCDERMAREYQSRFTYEKAKIYVRRLPNEEVQNGKKSSSNGDTKDTDFVQGGKRKNTEYDVSEKYARTEMTGQRRSSRKGHGKGEKEFTVSSDMTLKQFMFEVYKVFEVFKTDQHLFLDGEELMGDNRTLGELHVAPDTMLLLRVDESKNEDTDMTPSAAEQGFKGTGLVG